MPELIVKKEGRSVFRIPVLSKSIKIGRGSSNDVTLPDADISRLHAEVSFIDGNPTLCDKSTTGTRLNGNQIQTAVLKNGDLINIGSWDLFFHQNSDLDQEHTANVTTAVTRIPQDGSTRILSLDEKTGLFTVESTILTLETPKGKIQKNLGRKPVVIGSSPDADVVIDDEYVSGRHAELTFSGDGWMLKDLGSTNGTLVSGNKIVSAIGLTLGSVVTLGQSSFVLEAKQAKEKATPIAIDQFCGMVGKTPAMQELYAKIQKIAPTSYTVLVQGDSGSGKELIARAIHDLSPRAQKPYVILNCGAITPNLIESELFGHEKGAFTGAINRRAGAFEQAQGGTLFLDEIGELPLELQPKLLRVLENRSLRRVGGNEEITVDVRVIAATHRDLSAKVKEGSFRQDLFFRLCVLPLLVAPLSERKNDIPLLAEHVLKQAAQGQPKKLSPQAIEKLSRHDWPGNVRELKNTLLRSLIYCEGNVIDAKDIEIYRDTPPPSENSDSLNLAEVEKQKILEALKATDGQKNKAAELLGIAKSTLFKKLKDYGID